MAVNITKRLEESCLPLVEEWLADLQVMGSVEIKHVPEEDLRIQGFLLVRRVLEFVAQDLGLPMETIRGQEDFKELFLRSAAQIVDAIDNLEEYTAGRSRKVKEYAGRLAAMVGLKDEDIADIEYAARIHNIGLINTSQRLLRAPRLLSKEERSQVRDHSKVGAEMIRPIEFLSNIVPMIFYHHSHYDGSGYPGGVTGEDLPLGARIITLADSFEAMTSPRPHRPAMSEEEALQEIRKLSGRQFDPRLVPYAEVMRG